MMAQEEVTRAREESRVLCDRFSFFFFVRVQQSRRFEVYDRFSAVPWDFAGLARTLFFSNDTNLFVSCLLVGDYYGVGI